MRVDFFSKIYGAGATGLLIALALSKKEHRTLIIDPKPTDEILSRKRAYALTHSSRRILQDLDIWDELIPNLSPFNCLTIKDEILKQNLQLHYSDLTRNNRHTNFIGWVVDHQSLMQVLIDKVTNSPYIETFIGTRNLHNEFVSHIEIAADGANSPQRINKGIKNLKYTYKCGCLTAQILIRGVKPLEAFEILRSEGPLAILPMGGDKYQVVWTAPMYKCKELSSLSHSVFLDRLAAVLPNGFQPDIILDDTSYFPLELLVANSLYKDNLVLFGEAAHRFHPVGGQGLNVCWRDVNFLIKSVPSSSSLVKVSVRRLGQSYAIKRYPDIILIAIFTHLIILIYSSRNPLLLFTRYPFFPIISRSKLLRKLILKIATDGFV